MSLCFADSLKKYQEENLKPDGGATDDTPTSPGDSTVESDIFEGLGVVDTNAEWEEISDQGYEFYEDYQCDNVSAVIPSKKIVMKNGQLNFAQESNSQYIPFQMPRFFDGYDMAKTKIQFYYVNKDGQYGIDYAVNVYASEDRIRFAWLVSSSVTKISGSVRFEIQALGRNSNGKPYMWKTYPSSDINVEESLSATTYIEPDDNWQKNFYDDLDERMQRVLGLFDDAESCAKESVRVSEAAIQSMNQTRTTAENAINTVKTSAEKSVNSTKAAAETAISTTRESAVSEVTALKNEVVDASNAAKAEMSALREDIGDLVEDIYEERSAETIVNMVTEAMGNYHTKEEIKEFVDSFSNEIETINLTINGLDGLAKFSVEYDGSVMTFFNGETVINQIAINSDPTEEWTTAYTETIEATITDAFADYDKEVSETYATSASVSSLASAVSKNEAAIGTNTGNIQVLSEKMVEVEEIVNSVDTAPRLTYDITYDEEFKLSLWEQEGEDESTRTVKSQVIIQGGAGGGTSTTLKVEYVTLSPLTVTVDDEVKISYVFSGEDSSGDIVTDGIATWRVNSTIVATEAISAGLNTFDVTPYITMAGDYTVRLSVSDDAGSIVPKSWKVRVLDVRLESSFNDSFTYPIAPVTFDYTPHGAISKSVHFVLDGNELDTIDTSVSGIPMAFTIPAQSHGSHLLDVHMTADMNNDGEIDLRSNHITKDIIWFDENSTIPVIGCVMQNFTVKQYDKVNIAYTVHDPSTETPTVILSVDGQVVSTQKLEASTNIWQYSTPDIGNHILTIQCGDTVKTLNATVEKLDIDVEPVTNGLVFDFNPVGRFNSDADRLWTDRGISMSVSDNFDWTNGGYQIDRNGDQYFCIKAGTRATIDHKLFADDAKRNGKEFKLIFKTANVQRSDATFLTCMDNTTGDNHIGIQMDVHEARVYGQTGNLVLPYSENDIIEFEFNISKKTDAIPMVMGYEDGVATCPMVYDDSYDFTQVDPKFITIGSDACDLHIYRMKVYGTSLHDRNIMKNFIADARNAEDMIDRYNRNQIYDKNQNLNPDTLAEKCPWLRVYKLSAPYFTNNKSDKVPGTTIQQIYKDGDPVLDNWTCYDAMHSGQGTSSNNYGAAGRNLDFIMNKSGIDGVEPHFILGDGTEAEKITMTRTSVPVAYLNAKVNIASSNNMTNAMLANRYNKFSPYRRPFVRDEGEDISFIKDTMEFHNCVIFIQETDPDISTHREFADCNWHFYAIGNIGDSKKTDNTRLTDPNDEYECCVEVMDVELPLSDFPVETIINAMSYNVDEVTGEYIYLWAKDENLDILLEKIDGEYVPTQDTTVDLSKTYYVDALEHDDFSEDYTYGWRYIYEDGTDEKNAEVFNFCKQKWIEFYRFVTTSSDEEFKAHLKDYFVVDSALYYYLFTTRYCMIDNRAKNSFYHYAKTGELDSDGNPIRKWDLTWGYDMDSSLGLNNYGMQAYRHGLEDIDFDENGEEVFREADSTFFCRIRDLFRSELRTMYNTLESQNAWHAESFINQADAWQNEFPEELWRIDIERKYIRTYNGSFINGEGDAQFLTNMCNGRMKYHRRQWERAQEKYMASKYQSSVASSDNAVLRCTTPTGDLAVQPNYRLKLTPYDYMYLNVKYGTQSPIQIRANPGVEYEIPFAGSAADIIDIYSSSIIQSFGDLSSCYPATVDTSKASKIKELIVGNDTDGYDNPGLTTLTLGANDLLEVLNVENVSGLTQTLDVSALHNLKELYAHGSNVGGVTFASGGRIEIAELPAISSMTMRNLLYLIDLDITSFDKLTRLVVENCSTVDLLSVVEAAPNLNRVRIIGIDWDLENTDLLERIYAMSGIDKDGYNTGRAVISGKVYVPVIRERKLHEYSLAWPDLEIKYASLIEQFAVTFKNEDGTVVETQYVDKGGSAVDPTTRENNPLVMTKESSVSHYFTFAGWDSSLNEVFSDRVITATYTSALRTYTLRYASKGKILQETEGLYGDIVPYMGINPTYTNEETAYVYHLFSRWSDSGTINGDKTVEAVYDRFEYIDGVFDGRELSSLSPVEVYAMIKLGLSESVIECNDQGKGEYSFMLGNDFTYNDISSSVVISEPTYFDGNTYVNTGLKLFDEDKSFVIAIDYEFLDGNKTNSVLAQCFQSNGSNGFKLWYIDSATYVGSRITWGTVSENLVGKNKREMVVIRHVKGDNNLTIYRSNIDGDSVSYASIVRTRTTKTDSELVFGASLADDGVYENFGIGNINWCKIWHGDIGDDACRQLAVWPRELINLETCGFRNYYLTSNSSQRCAFSLLATNLLDKQYPWTNGVNSNSGGWANSELNRQLNTRLYNAVPTQIKALIKQVNIPSSIGDKSTEVDTSPCYITVPACIELDPTMTSDPYINEGRSISYMTTNASRMRAFADGTYGSYWTRSPNASFNNYVYKVNANGALNGFNIPYYEAAVLIEISF